MNLYKQLETTLQGRICLIGIGNTDYRDDGFGVRLGEELVGAGLPDTIVAGTTPEAYMAAVCDREFDHVVFIDAIEFGGEPGSVVFLDATEMESRCPQISTHKLALSMLARFVESNGVTKAWLLGVQPESVGEGQEISARIRTTLDVLRELLFRLKAKEVLVC